MTNMTVDHDLVQLWQSLFEDWHTRRDRQQQFDVSIDLGLWKTLNAAGLTTLMPGSDSQTDLGWLEVVSLLSTAAGHAAPIPLAEHVVLAGVLRAAAGLTPTGRPSTACVLDVDGQARSVPWAGAVSTVVLLWPKGSQWWVAEIEASSADLTPQRDLSGRPNADIRVDLNVLAGSPVRDDVAADFLVAAKLARCAQIVGAMNAVIELAASHASTREQFGQRLSSFRGVQVLITSAASEAALASATVEQAAMELAKSAGSVRARLLVAVAASVTSRCSSVVVRNAHQVHGAIGTTLEHELQASTRPIMAWQREFGSALEWEQEIARRLMDQPGSVWSAMAPLD